MGHTCVVNLEDRRVNRKEQEGNSEGVVPRGKCFRRERLCQMLLRGQVRSGPKLTIEFSNVEKFGELGKGRFCGEVEVKA